MDAMKKKSFYIYIVVFLMIVISKAFVLCILIGQSWVVLWALIFFTCIALDTLYFVFQQLNKTPVYRFKWKNNTTGKSGYGNWNFSALSTVETVNSKNHDLGIDYWIETSN